MANHVKYKGDAAKGEFITGVPARDMDRERWERIPERLRKFALSTGFYELVAKQAKAEPEEVSEDKEE